jgi:hypothetical protein
VSGCGGASQTAVAEAVMHAGVAAAITAADWIDEATREREAQRRSFPSDGCPAWECYASADMTLEEAREYALKYINHARSNLGLPPVTLDFALNAFAQSGSRDLSRNHRVHRYIAEHAMECPLCAESQGDPEGVEAAPIHDQLDAVLCGMVSEPPGGSNRDVLLAPERHRVGVGIVNPDGRTYLTVESAP